MCVSLSAGGPQTLWAYTAVFASAGAYAAPRFAGGDEGANYVIYALLFAALVVPLSCLELDEQVAVQVTMTIARLAMLGLMLGTCSQCARDAGLAREGAAAPPPLARPRGLSVMVPIMVFAHIYHHSIPGTSPRRGNRRPRCHGRTRSRQRTVTRKGSAR